VRVFRIAVVAFASVVVVVAVVMLANVGTGSTDLRVESRPTPLTNSPVVVAAPIVTIVRHGSTTYVASISHP
jgi:hypothetical protein